MKAFLFITLIVFLSCSQNNTPDPEEKQKPDNIEEQEHIDKSPEILTAGKDTTNPISEETKADKPADMLKMLIDSGMTVEDILSTLEKRILEKITIPEPTTTVVEAKTKKKVIYSGDKLMFTYEAGYAYSHDEDEHYSLTVENIPGGTIYKDIYKDETIKLEPTRKLDVMKTDIYFAKDDCTGDIYLPYSNQDTIPIVKSYNGKYYKPTNIEKVEVKSYLSLGYPPYEITDSKITATNTKCRPLPWGSDKVPHPTFYDHIWSGGVQTYYGVKLMEYEPTIQFPITEFETIIE
jgi:hypothetical protein